MIPWFLVGTTALGCLGNAVGGTGLEPKRGSQGWRHKFGSNEAMSSDGSHGIDGLTRVKYSLKNECERELRDTSEE